MNPLAIIGGILLLALLGGKKRPQNSSGSSGSDLSPSDAEKRQAFADVSAAYGKDLARRIEQIFRLETRHFDSRQFRESLSAGMEAVQGRDSFPWGWSSLRQFVEENPELGAPHEYGVIEMRENIGGDPSKPGNLKRFVKFPNFESAALFTAFMVNKRGGDAGKWHSLDDVKAMKYRERLDGVRTPIVDSL